MTVETAIVAGVVLVLLLGLVFALRRKPAGEPPLIAASVKPLRRGLYQIDIKVTNRARHALVGETLRRMWPHSAKLLAPIKQVSTREGDFQVWSDPDGDTPSTKIPVDLVLGPWQPEGGEVSLSAEGLIAAWLFLPKEKDLARLDLELAMREEGGKLRRHRFGVTPF